MAMSGGRPGAARTGIEGGLGTRLDPEEFCYPDGHWRRRGVAWCECGHAHPIKRAGIADTFFSIPAGVQAHGKYHRGFLSLREFYGLPVLYFTAYKSLDPNTPRDDEWEAN